MSETSEEEEDDEVEVKKAVKSVKSTKSKIKNAKQHEDFDISEISLFPSNSGTNKILFRNHCYHMSSSSDKRLYYVCDKFKSEIINFI